MVIEIEYRALLTQDSLPGFVRLEKRLRDDLTGNGWRWLKSLLVKQSIKNRLRRLPPAAIGIAIFIDGRREGNQGKQITAASIKKEEKIAEELASLLPDCACYSTPYWPPRVVLVIPKNKLHLVKDTRWFGRRL